MKTKRHAIPMEWWLASIYTQSEQHHGKRHGVISPRMFFSLLVLSVMVDRYQTPDLQEINTVCRGLYHAQTSKSGVGISRRSSVNSGPFRTTWLIDKISAVFSTSAARIVIGS